MPLTVKVSTDTGRWSRHLVYWSESMSRRWIVWGAVPLSMVWLSACSVLDTTRKLEKPEVKFVAAAGSTVMVTDAQTGSPVELRVDQQLIVRLATQGTSAAQWMLVGFTPGVLAAPGPSRFDRDLVSAAYAQLAGAEVWQFKPVQAGEVTLTFELRRPRGREGSIRTVTYAVTVR